MVDYPRDRLAEIPAQEIQKALGSLVWVLIRDRIETLDESAIGGVSADATIIAALVKRCCDLSQSNTTQTTTESAE